MLAQLFAVQRWGRVLDVERAGDDVPHRDGRAGDDDNLGQHAPGTVIGQYGSADVAGGYGFALSDPSTIVAYSSSPSPDLFYVADGFEFHGQAIVPQPGEPTDYHSCTTDTRYVTSTYGLSSLPAGAEFCILDSQRIALVQIKTISNYSSPSQYYEFSVTVWQG